MTTNAQRATFSIQFVDPHEAMQAGTIQTDQNRPTTIHNCMHTRLFFWRTLNKNDEEVVLSSERHLLYVVVVARALRVLFNDGVTMWFLRLRSDY